LIDENTLAVLNAIRDGFVQLNNRMELYSRSYLDKEIFDRLFETNRSSTHQNAVRINELELRQEEISRFAEVIKNNTENINRLEKRMENAPGRNMQYITTGIAIIGVLIAILSHFKFS